MARGEKRARDAAANLAASDLSRPNARPGARPFRALPVLEKDRTSLETCAFCPKLCRGACPVTDALPRETLTPWGKMSSAYFTALGDAPLEASFVEASYACTGCFGCREACDHKNDVTTTLFDSRAAYVDKGVAPAAAKETIAHFAEHEERTRESVARLGGAGFASTPSEADVLIGCGYTLKLEEEARAAAHVTRALLGRAPKIAGGCCGLPLLHAGDQDGFKAHVERAVQRWGGKRILVVDPGCATALTTHAKALGVEVPEVVPLVGEVARSLHRLKTLPAPVLRYHDPCQLSRGLGLTAEPRAILQRITGRAPSEFVDHHEHGRCSGAGGLLPKTLPQVAQGMARARLEEVPSEERVVTACASSLRQFRKEREADDIVTWIARSMA